MAETKFDLVKMLGCHFRMYGCVIISFRKDCILIQTPSFVNSQSERNANGLYTTHIPLSSMKSYDFKCGGEDVNVLVSHNLVTRRCKSKCVSVIGTAHGKVEVTFDLKHFKCKPKTCYESRLYGFFTNNGVYDSFVIDSVLSYSINKYGASGLCVTLEDSSKLARMFCHSGWDGKVYVKPDGMEMKRDGSTFHIGLEHKAEFVFDTKSLKKVMKF